MMGQFAVLCRPDKKHPLMVFQRVNLSESVILKKFGIFCCGIDHKYPLIISVYVRRCQEKTLSIR
jgi:hypothetical protein